MSKSRHEKLKKRLIKKNATANFQTYILAFQTEKLSHIGDKSFGRWSLLPENLLKVKQVKQYEFQIKRFLMRVETIHVNACADILNG